MAFIVGTKNINRRIIFDAESDLGEKIPSSFIVTVERPTKQVSKEFGLLFAEFADVLAEREKGHSDEAWSVKEFTEKVDAAEQALSDFVKEKVSGWEDLFDPQKQPLEFNQTTLSCLFADREARRAVFEDYQELVSGRKKEATDNLKKLEPVGSDQSQQ